MELNATAPICSFRSSSFVLVLAAFAGKHHIRLCLVAFGVVLSPLIFCVNGTVLLAVLRRPSLHTPANLVISCMLLADFLVGAVFLPLYTAWTSSDFVRESCPLSGLLLCTGWIVSFVSFFSLVVMSCERYIVLFRPLVYPTIVTIRRASTFIAIVWILALFESICSLFKDLTAIRYIISGFSLSIGLAVIGFTYARIAKLVRQHQKRIRSHQILANTNTARQRKLTITTAYLLCVTLICYTPFGVTLLVVVSQGGFSDRAFLCFHISELLFCLSSLFNPLIYCMRNQEIRAGVFSLLANLQCKSKGINGSTNKSNGSTGRQSGGRPQSVLSARVAYTSTRPSCVIHLPSNRPTQA